MLMSNDDIALEISNFIVNNFPTNFDKETLPRDTSMMSLQILDSFGILNLLFFVESNWNIEVTTTEVTVENFDTVDGIANFVISKLAQA